MSSLPGVSQASFRGVSLWPLASVSENREKGEER